MGTLKKLKLQMKLDKKLRHSLVKGTKNEILIDLDGDKEADLALLDTTKNGDIDTIAFDLTGDGEFDLYLYDSNENGLPDTIAIDDGEGHFDVVASGEEVELHFLHAAGLLYKACEISDYVTETIDDALDEIYKEFKKFKKELRKQKN